jgi:hypothetical protein
VRSPVEGEEVMGATMKHGREAAISCAPLSHRLVRGRVVSMSRNGRETSEIECGNRVRGR